MISLKRQWFRDKNSLNTLSCIFIGFLIYLCSPNISFSQDIAQLAVKARNNLYEQWDFEQAASYFDQVIGKKYAPAFAYSDYGWYLMLLDRHDEGMKYVQRAAEMAPDDKQLVAWYAWALIWDKDLQKAKQWIEKALNIDASYGEALHISARIEYELGNHEEAIKLAHKASTSDAMWRGILPVIYAKTGDRQRAEESTKEISQSMNAFDAMFATEVYAILGHEEKALDYLEKAYDLRHPFMPWLEIVPELMQLHEHSRFQAVLEKMGLPK